MKTIRQIADEIGVSKQAVYKRYKGKLHTVCAPYAHTEQGVLYLSEQAETLIKQDFLKADRSNGAHTERPIGAVSEQLKEADVVSVLQATIDTLQEQLEVKDQQIEKLTEALLAAQKTAAAAQALHAGMIQQQFLTNRDEIEEQGEGPVERQGWLRRLFMDEATPHLHVDFIPVATEQSRGLSTRVSMKQALKQQGFVSLGRKQTEWNAWMEREKAALTEIAQAHEFEIISLGGGRPHMDLPEYRAAAQRLEAVQEQVTAAEHDMAELEKQRKALQGTVRRLQAAEKVRVDLEAIQPERTLTGAVRGVTVEQVEDLKAAAIRGTVAEHDVRELKEENRQLRSRLPSVKEQLKEAEEQQRLLNENYDLRVEVEYLTESLNSERDFSSRLLEGIGAVLDFLDRHLPEQFRPLVEKARELLPVPELQQPEQEQERGHTWGGMEL